MRLFRSFSYLSVLYWVYSLNALLVLVVTGQFCTQVFGFNMGKYLRFKSGAVYARAIIKGDNGQPIYVAYDSEGKERLIGEVDGNFADSSIMSGDTYRAYADQVQELRSIHEQDSPLPLVSKDQYNSETFLDSVGQTIGKSNLQDDTVVVLLRTEDQRTPKLPGQSEFERLILAEFPVDLIADPDLPENISSIIVSDEGGILERAQPGENIGYKVGFYGEEDNQVAVGGFGRKFEDKIHGTIKNVFLDMGPVLIGGMGLTDEEGK